MSLKKMVGFEKLFSPGGPATLWGNQKRRDAKHEGRVLVAADATSKQAAIDAEAAATAERLTQEEEARKKLREAGTGGYASNILTGSSGLTSTPGGAGRILSGS